MFFCFNFVLPFDGEIKLYIFCVDRALEPVDWQDPDCSYSLVTATHE